MRTALLLVIGVAIGTGGGIAVGIGCGASSGAATAAPPVTPVTPKRRIAPRVARPAPPEITPARR